MNHNLNNIYYETCINSYSYDDEYVVELKQYVEFKNLFTIIDDKENTEQIKNLCFDCTLGGIYDCFLDLFKWNKDSGDVIQVNIYLEKLLSILGYNYGYFIDKYKIGNNEYEINKKPFTLTYLKRIINAFRAEKLDPHKFKISFKEKEFDEEEIRKKYEINFMNHRMTFENFCDKMSSFLDENVQNGIFFYILRVRFEDIGKYCSTEFLNDKIKEIDEGLKEIDYPIKVEGVGVNDFKFCLDKDNKKSRMIRIGVFEKDTSKELCVFGELFRSFFQGSYILVKNRCTYSELRKYICDVFSSINNGNNGVLNNFVFHNGNKEIENEDVEIEGNDVYIFVKPYKVIRGSVESAKYKSFSVQFYYKYQEFYRKRLDFNESIELSVEQLYSFVNKWLDMYSNGEFKNCKLITLDDFDNPDVEITNETDLNSLIIAGKEVRFRALIDLNTSPLYKKYSIFGGKNIHIDDSNGKTIKNTSDCMCCSSCIKP